MRIFGRAVQATKRGPVTVQPSVLMRTHNNDAEGGMSDTTTWKNLPAIQGVHGGRLNCGPRPNFFPPSGVIAVGFGYAALHRDGEAVWAEPSADYDEDALLTGAQAEVIAEKDPNHDWRIVLEGPLSGRTYQRHGPGEWALIEQNEGFA